MEEKKETILEEQEDLNKDVIKLSRPYLFEGEEITEINLSGLEDIGVQEMIQASDILSNSGRVVPIPESDIQYTLFIAHAATGLPYEFFMKLKAKDAVRVRAKVTLFFNRRK